MNKDAHLRKSIINIRLEFLIELPQVFKQATRTFIAFRKDVKAWAHIESLPRRIEERSDDLGKVIRPPIVKCPTQVEERECDVITVGRQARGAHQREEEMRASNVNPTRL